MKFTTRRKLYCSKKLPCGIIDSFTVWVAASEVDAAKQRYKSMGYDVQ